MSRMEALKQKYTEIQPDLDKATQITRKAHAENRALTATEAEFVNPVIEKVGAIHDAIKQCKGDEALMARAREFANEVGGVGGKSDHRLSFKGMAGRLAANMLGGSGFAKALAPSGAAVVGQEFKPDPVALGQPAVSLLDVLPVVQHSSPEFSYLRQTTRTNAAAIVAAGAVKPTSTYTVQRVEESLDVIAHLSEGIARHWLIDNASLETFLANELEYGLQVAVEAKVLADVNATSGIQTAAYATSVLATLRAGITKLEVSGYSPSSFILTPGDWATTELAVASTNAVEHLGLPYDASRRTLFGVPVVTSNAQAAGVGHVLATGAVAVDTDTRGVDVQWSENATADSFSKNLVFARCEARYATSVYSPLGVVSCDLTV